MINTRKLIPLLFVLTALLVLPAVAAAGDVEPTPPVETSIKISFAGLHHGAVLTGSGWKVNGTVSKYVAGQTVRVRLFQHGRTIRTRELAIKDDAGVGRFSLAVKLAKSGRVTVRAAHTATAEMASVQARPAHMTVAARYAKAGSRGYAVRYLQQKLANLGYVVGRRGYYDSRTGRAVMAFRKITGMQRNFIAGSLVYDRLARGWGRFKVRYKNHGRHIEGDLTHQVMALIDHGKAVRIYPISSGKPSTPTVLGNFRVYMKVPGTNAIGMIYSSFFIGGFAIHGYVDVPIYPASHGCIRVPPPEAISVYNWVRMGTRVDTYYR